MDTTPPPAVRCPECGEPFAPVVQAGQNVKKFCSPTCYERAKKRRKAAKAREQARRVDLSPEDEHVLELLDELRDRVHRVRGEDVDPVDTPARVAARAEIEAGIARREAEFRGAPAA